MKITDIVVHRLSIPLPRPVRTARHNHAHADTVAVEMRADNGLVGSGYCFAFGRRQAAALAALVEDFADLYRGQTAAPQARFAEAWRGMHFIGHTGLALMALSAVDTACWDLAARGAGQPLFRYLGGDKTRVPTYASSGLWIDYSVDELLREAEAFLAQGHRAMKMRVGRVDPEEDVERVRILRDALGTRRRPFESVGGSRASGSTGWKSRCPMRISMAAHASRRHSTCASPPARAIMAASP
jgi:L-alanine-DL-glutamate epimerase-like enolase superfamily enzyme